MSLLTLAEALASVPDPRSRDGRRYPFAPVLCLVALGPLMGKRTVGFPRGRGPVESLLSRPLRRADAGALEAALSRWLAPRLPEDADAFSLDGKTLRGSRGGGTPGVHLVAAYAPGVEAVLGQTRVDAGTNEHEAALEWLGILPPKGKVVLGDAASCRRDLAKRVVDQGGDYVLFARGNQPSLVMGIQARFAYDAAAAERATAFPP